MSELRRTLNTDRAVNDLENEGAEGFDYTAETHEKIAQLTSEMLAFKLVDVNGKIHDADDWAEVRAAWNAVIMANKDKGQAAMLAAATQATGYTYDQIAYLKSVFA
jgi:hypothetical protein